MAAVTNVSVLEITGSVDMQVVRCKVNNATGDYFVSKFSKIKGMAIGTEGAQNGISFSTTGNPQVAAFTLTDAPPYFVNLIIFGS